MALAFTIAFLTINIVLQIFCVIHVALLMAIYVLLVGPMVEDIEDLLSTHNEVLVLFFSSYVFLFSDYTTDPEAHFAFGYVYLVLFGSALLVNIAISCYLTFLMIKTELKKRKIK